MQLKADFYTALQNNTKINNLIKFIQKQDIAIRTTIEVQYRMNKSEN